jgi:hypothetical protein
MYGSLSVRPEIKEGISAIPRIRPRCGDSTTLFCGGLDLHKGAGLAQSLASKAWSSGGSRFIASCLLLSARGACSGSAASVRWHVDGEDQEIGGGKEGLSPAIAVLMSPPRMFPEIRIGTSTKAGATAKGMPVASPDGDKDDKSCHSGISFTLVRLAEAYV